jgi:hypothetical protein
MIDEAEAGIFEEEGKIVWVAFSRSEGRIGLGQGGSEMVFCDIPFGGWF